MHSYYTITIRPKLCSIPTNCMSRLCIPMTMNTRLLSTHLLLTLDAVFSTLAHRSSSHDPHLNSMHCDAD